MTTRLPMIAALALALPLLGLPTKAKAQLRIVSWNTATGTSSPGYGGRQSDFNNVLDFIGREEVNGVAKPIDVLVLQEQSDVNSTVASFAAELNAISGTSNYVGWSQNPFGTDGLDTGFVYNSAAVTPFLEDWLGTGSSRATARIGLTPVGYTNATLYIYSTHHTAGTGQGDLTERRNEAFSIRLSGSNGSTNSGDSGVAFGSDSLPANSNIIYAGDFNQKTSSEEASNDPFPYISNPYQILQLDSGATGFSDNGEAVDPIDAPGSWTNNSSFADIHTQSPHDGSFGLVTGGMDDRFDFQMTSTALNNGEGLSYIGPNAGDSTAAAESYHTFGNNGTTYNTHAGSSGNSGLDWIITQGETLPGLTATQTRDAVRSSLARASDHSPVVADYQLPGILGAVADSVPATLTLGQPFSVDVTVSNDASVVAAVGADEVDWSLNSSGDISGSGAGSVYATQSGDVVSITLDTSTVGAKSGTVTMTSGSLSVENPLISIPFSYTVSAALLGDTDVDGDIDADDIDTLYANLGSSDSLFDIDLDGGAADQQDVDQLVQSILSTEYGDVNLDLTVNAVDISTLSGSFGLSGGWANGNLNGDTVINATDISILSGNFGFTNLSPASSAPEASSLALAALCCVGFSAVSRGRWVSA